MITREKKQAVLDKLANNKKDTGSVAVQVGILTERIKELTEHLKVSKKDFSARRALLQMVGRRRRLLKYLADKDSQAYLDLIEKVGLRK
jgi:small subunit ribosomal protein S15